MGTRAKFYLESAKRMKWGTEVTLRAVTRGEDNKEWAAATPVGALTMTIKNPAATADYSNDAVDESREFYMILIPVDEADQGQEGMG